MCGISGVISSRYINHHSLNEMNKIIKHRGPDDEGFVLFKDNEFEVLGGFDTASESRESHESYSPRTDIISTTFEGHVGFGHRRLSILDLSPKGHQPMCSKDERFWITYNGEIYNYIEIRIELINLGYTFITDTDTEVILSAYQEWGVDCQHRFNGMWAFAIYDRKEKTIFLSRDRFGIKPLYYWYSPEGNFYFASEIKQFTVLPGWKAVLNKVRALDYLYDALTDHTEESLFKGVYSIPPSHYVHLDLEKIKTNRSKIVPEKWYTIIVEDTKQSFDEAKNEFLKRFKDSVKLHLRADVAVGSALSGGIDSSSIVSYINSLLKKENKSYLQKTFSSCSEDPKYDEKIWMEEVVKETQVDGHYVYPKGEDVFKLTEKLTWFMDEPYQSQSAFLGYHVFMEAKKNDVVVLLNGQGADEYLSGYGSYKYIRQINLLRKFKLKKLYTEFNKTAPFFRFILVSILNRLPLLKQKIKAKNGLDKVLDFNKIGKKSGILDFIDMNSHVNVSKNQLFVDPLPRYLRWEDRNSMAHSVEARVPFLDYRLIELVHSLPLTYLDGPNQSKYILVEAMKGILPEKVRNRKDKKGFITPEQKWFMLEFRNEFIKLFEDNVQYAKGIINKDEGKKYLYDMQNGKIPFDYSYWRIILFCIWMKTFNVEID